MRPFLLIMVSAWIHFGRQRNFGAPGIACTVAASDAGAQARPRHAQRARRARRHPRAPLALGALRGAARACTVRGHGPGVCRASIAREAARACGRRAMVGVGLTVSGCRRRIRCEVLSQGRLPALVICIRYIDRRGLLMPNMHSPHDLRPHDDRRGNTANGTATPTHGPHATARRPGAHTRPSSGRTASRRPTRPCS